MKQRLFLLLVPIFLLISQSCKKMIAIDPPKNQLVTEIIFKDSADATGAVVGIYIRIMTSITQFNICSGALTAYTAVASDEMYPNTTNPSLQQFYNNSVSTDNDLNGSLWQFAYQIIYQANACIEGLTQSSTLNTSLRSQLLGEVKFLRALLYFNLVNTFGTVPLVISPDYKITASLGRASLDEIYAQMIVDLTEARQLLSTDYLLSPKARPNSYTASALLARIYLFRQQWTEANTEATRVITANNYLLEPNLDNVFLSNSRETIWQLRTVQPSAGTTEAISFIPVTATRIPNYIITTNIINSFEPNDNRKSKWIKFTGFIGGQTYPYPFKYKLRSSATSEESYVVLRLAEQLLIRAEARTHLTDITNAKNDLNAVRNRAGLPNTLATDEQSLLTAIEQERKVELFAEWGHRWFDLKRLGKINTVLSVAKAPNWQPTDALFPVPLNEINTNPFLVQNPGY